MTIEEIKRINLKGRYPLKDLWAEFLLSKLKKDEKVQLSFVARKTTDKEKLIDTFGAGSGLVLVTDKRILFGMKNDSWLFKGEQFQDFILTEKTTVEGGGNSRFWTWIKLTNSSGEIILSDLKEQNKIIDVISNIIRLNNNNDTSNDLDVFEKIKRLKDLLDNGILDEDEFNSKKNELLKSI